MSEVSLSKMGITIHPSRGQTNLEQFDLLPHGSEPCCRFLVISKTRRRQALEYKGKEIVEGEHEGVLPLSGEVDCEGWILLRIFQERESKPVFPFRLTLKIRRQLFKKFS